MENKQLPIKYFQNIQSLAFRDAEIIKGKADATATLIYAKAYDKSSQSRSLYGFLKSMETFEKTFDRKTSIFISTDSELYKTPKKDGLTSYVKRLVVLTLFFKKNTQTDLGQFPLREVSVYL